MRDRSACGSDQQVGGEAKLLRNHHLRSAGHRVAGGRQKRQDKFENVAHLYLNRATGAVGKTGANREIVRGRDPSCHGGQSTRAGVDPHRRDTHDVSANFGRACRTVVYSVATASSHAGPPGSLPCRIGNEVIAIQRPAEINHSEHERKEERDQKRELYQRASATSAAGPDKRSSRIPF